ncbi:MAG TPA: hypothetical protein DHV26_05530 [Cytophagales bacterium]|nr:hypothetical protein [Cytophagales bacterium]HRG08986.1 hypothetical protein [Cyclobacteriaceae bacterium]
MKDEVFSFEIPLNPNLGSETFRYNYFTVYKYFDKVYSEVTSWNNYMAHRTAFRSGKKISNETLKSEDYVIYFTSKLEPFANHGLKGFDSVIELIEEIKRSSLIEEDIQGFLKQIRFEMVDEYIKYIDSISITKEYFMLPRTSKPDVDDMVIFEPFYLTAISRHYQYFKKELYSIV